VSRRRARPTRSSMALRLRSAAPPAVAVALVLLGALLPYPHLLDRSQHTVAVSRTAYACPPGAQVAVGQVAPASGVTATDVSKGTRVTGLESVRQWRGAAIEGTTVVDQVGRGSGAVGFFTLPPQPDRGDGLMVGSCPATVDESWFVGLGSGVKHLSSLVLTNISDVVAVADVTLWGTEGEIEAVGGDGLVLKPQESRTIAVDAFAAGEAEVAVRVERRRGSFAVTAIDGSTRSYSGSEIAPPTAAPRRTQILSGLPAKAKFRTLVIANPTHITSRVSVEMIGPKGSFAPSGLEAIRVPAGRVTSVEVPTTVGGSAMAVRLTSEQPILATARVAEDKEDYAYAVAERRLDGPAIVPIALAEGVGRPRLTVTAPGSHAAVTIEGFDGAMHTLGSERREIRAGTTSTVDLGKLADSDRLAYIVVRPHGNVMGAATFRTDKGIASIPLEGAPVRVIGPDVQVIG
jgi:hypothetical protein